MKKTRIGKIEFTAIKHATEKEEILLGLIKKIIPPEEREKITIDKRITKGHHGNEIIVLKTHLTGKEAEKTVKHLLKKLETQSRILLINTLERRIQGNNILHIRINKQYLVENRFILWDSDEALKITIRFNEPITKNMIESILEEVKENE